MKVTAVVERVERIAVARATLQATPTLAAALDDGRVTAGHIDAVTPVCVRHHHNIHDNNWQITLGPNHQLTITHPDDTIHNTGPPHRRAG